MTNKATPVRRLPHLLSFTLGILLTAAACGVLAKHARLFSEKRDTAVMIGTQLPELKAQVALLDASVEAERIFAERALAAREEQASVYVLPKGSPVSRVVSSVQEIVLGLKNDGPLALKSIAFQKKPDDHGSVKTVQGTLVLEGRFTDIAAVLTVLGFGGDLMVRDVLPLHDQELFLEEVGRVAPLTLKRAQDFLYLDLLEYAAAPDTAEGRLTADAASDIVLSLRSMLLQAGLASVRSALGPVADELKASELWPLPLVRIDRVIRNGNTWTITLTALGR